MDPNNNHSSSSNENHPFRHLPLGALPMPEQHVYNVLHAPPAAGALPDHMHEFAALNPNPDYNPAMELFKHQMQFFWRHQFLELNNVQALKQQLLPLARIKRVMKANPAVKMISADTPLVFSKACEMFIMELTFRAWLHTEDSDRKTLERGDLINAMSRADMYSFLLPTVP